jgi:hypothetical protein
MVVVKDNKIEWIGAADQTHLPEHAPVIRLRRDYSPRLNRHSCASFRIDTAAEARVAIRGYGSTSELWRRFQTESLIFPRIYNDAFASGVAIVGSPQAVEAVIRRQLDESGSNDLVGRFAFGNLSYAAISRCIELFAGKVMPAISRQAA